MTIAEANRLDEITQGHDFQECFCGIEPDGRYICGRCALAALDKARCQALEEAARICDREGYDCAGLCAKAIREAARGD